MGISLGTNSHHSHLTAQSPQSPQWLITYIDPRILHIRGTFPFGLSQFGSREWHVLQLSRDPLIRYKWFWDFVYESMSLSSKATIDTTKVHETTLFPCFFSHDHCEDSCVFVCRFPLKRHPSSPILVNGWPDGHHRPRTWKGVAQFFNLWPDLPMRGACPEALEPGDPCRIFVGYAIPAGNGSKEATWWSHYGLNDI